MEKKTMNPFKMRTANIVAFLFVVFCFGFVYLLAFYEVPDVNKDLINFLAGILFGTGLGGVIYWLYNYRKDGAPSSSNNSVFCPVCGKPFSQGIQDFTLTKKNRRTPAQKPRPQSFQSQPANQVQQMSAIDSEDEEQINPDKRLDIQ